MHLRISDWNKVQRIVILLFEDPKRGCVYDKIRARRQHQPKLVPVIDGAHGNRQDLDHLIL
jgi:hypothetical protein